ncbi:hypothetical protein SAY86_014674 [Trapa natans]|uniref:TCP domain-containing protein n=1 Tax=Trapa natans TaxID=22666 RepID=A0AAN7QGW7_TRANT|nr:hypothetical protein SAY86_014674 [Trapa natans]
MKGSRDASKEVAISLGKQEAVSTSEDVCKTVSLTASSLASTPWFKLVDSRVARVSRAMGGKDRHSKVCTIRGLRDRRVRLSVPTAIQLYDLQDRLGLSQPSKVVDWLLNAAKHEIDELPPLLFHPGQPPIFHQHSSLETGRDVSPNRDQLGLATSGMGLYEGGDPSKSSRQERRSDNSDNASRDNQVHERQEVGEGKSDKLGNFSARTAENPSDNPYGSNIYHHLEPSSIGLPNFPLHGLIPSQGLSEDPRSFNFVQTPSSLSTVSQIHSYFPLQFITPSWVEMYPRHVSQFQPTVVSSGLQNFLPYSQDRPMDALTHHHLTVSVREPVDSLDVNARVVQSQARNSSGNEIEKD